MYHYASSTNGFYNTEIHGENIPSDAVEITEEEWKTLLDGQTNGQEITSDKDGKPVLVDRVINVVPQPVLTAAEKLESLGLTAADLKEILGLNA